MPSVIDNPTKLQSSTPADLWQRETEIRSGAKPGWTGITAEPLAGTWTNVDEKTSGLAKLVITVAGTGIVVRGFGACVPTLSDWGTVSGMVFAENVVSNPAIAFTSTFSFPFKETTVVGHLDAGLLIVETFDHFIDKSGRSDYFSRFYLENKWETGS